MDDAAPLLSGYRKLFLCGSARSGTTWLRNLFRAHPDAVAHEESHVGDVILRPWRNPPRLRSLSARLLGGPDPRVEAVLERYDRQALRASETGTGVPTYIGRPELEQLLREASERSDLVGLAKPLFVIERIFDRWFSENGGSLERVFVEKTPRHIFYAVELLRGFPESRLIEIVRDGRDVCVSLEELGKHRRWARRGRKEYFQNWRRSIEAGDALLADPELGVRVHRVRYEALKTDPVAALRELFDFAGLRSDEALTRQIADEQAFSRMPRGVFFRKGVVGDWVNHFDERQRADCEREIGDLLRRLGYTWELPAES